MTLGRFHLGSASFVSSAPHSPLQMLLAALLRRLPEITGEEQLASKEENTLWGRPLDGAGAPGSGESSRGSEASLPGDRPGLRSSDSVAFGPVLLAHPHNDSEKLCTPSTFAARHLSIPKQV